MMVDLSSFWTHTPPVWQPPPSSRPPSGSSTDAEWAWGTSCTQSKVHDWLQVLSYFWQPWQHFGFLSKWVLWCKGQWLAQVDWSNLCICLDPHPGLYHWSCCEDRCLLRYLGTLSFEHVRRLLCFWSSSCLVNPKGNWNSWVSCEIFSALFCSLQHSRLARIFSVLQLWF